MSPPCHGRAVRVATHVTTGPLRSRRQWRAAAQAAGLEAQRGGPGGLPAALAPPDDAERLARGLARTL